MLGVFKIEQIKMPRFGISFPGDYKIYKYFQEQSLIKAKFIYLFLMHLTTHKNTDLFSAPN